MDTASKSILLVDDHRMLREMLGEWIHKTMSFEKVSHASSGEQVVKGLQTQKFDVIILDIHLEGESGFDLLTHIKQNYKDTKVIMLSMHEHELYITNSKNHGADGYVLKGSSFKFLEKAINRVLNDKTYFQFEHDKEGYSVEQGVWDEKAHLLSGNEEKIVTLVADGINVKNIAVQMNISLSTVNTYLKRARDKLGVKTTAELVQKLGS